MSKQVIAVIHVADQTQAYENCRIAEDTGCDGAFLITHGEVSSESLWDIYFNLMRVTRLPLGINQLGWSTSSCLAYAHSRGRKEGLQVPLVWTDNYKRTHDSGQSCPLAVREYQQRVHQTGLLLFGGVAFKHQPEEHLRGTALREEVVAALSYVDVVTTSGVSTGTAPDISKIETIRDALGPHKLAVASGITPDNVDYFLPLVDYFLVSTGISKDFYRLDPIKAHRLTSRVKDW